MRRFVVDFNTFVKNEGIVDNYDDDNAKEIVVKKDKLSGLPVADKTNVPIKDQLKVLAKDLYQTTMKLGRYQTLIGDKITKFQELGADEQTLANLQSSLNDEMVSLQNKAMDVENKMYVVAAKDAAMSQKVQDLTSEAKFLANKKNEEWFKERREGLEIDLMQQLQQTQDGQKQSSVENSKYLQQKLKKKQIELQKREMEKQKK